MSGQLVRMIIFARKSTEGEITAALFPTLKVKHFERVGLVSSEDELDFTTVHPFYIENGRLHKLERENVKYYAKRSYLVYYMEVADWEKKS